MSYQHAQRAGGARSFGRNRSFSGSSNGPSRSAGGGRSYGHSFNRSSGSYGARSSRGGQRSFFRPQQYINPARYVSAAVELEPEVARPITHSFADFGLNEQLLKNVLEHGYTTPTPIQDQAIEPLMEGRDVVGIANTGTGKTAAFLLPLIHKLTLDPNQGVLIVAPTRELALQIQEELRAFVRGLQFSVSLCIGGANLDRQMRELRQNPHFVIGTPGRLKDLIMRGAFDTSLFTNIVLDEVDRMLDIGFLKDVQFLISKLPAKRQAAFFSATITREVSAIMQTLLTDPVQITIKSRETSNQIEQDVVRVASGKSKFDTLYELLIKAEFTKVIVFGRTKHGINSLEEYLSNKGLRVSAIHGNKSQNARQRSLNQFKQGYVQALLATDVAARGIDIEDVTHVINYDEPQSYEDYIHRIGRTGRAGKTGKALTFISA